MSIICPKFIRLPFSFLLIITLFLTIGQDSAYAAPCGNGVCQASQGETCSTCPADCGICAPTATPASPPPAPTNTPAPTSPPAPTLVTAPGQPTSTPAPGGPTATPSQSNSSSSSSTSSSNPSVTYRPFVTVTTYSPNPTNKVPLTFSGTTSIEQGKVASIEYTITDGAQWLPAQLSNGSFTFTTSSLAEGKYTVKVRAKSEAGVFTQETNYAAQTITIATTPPGITLDKIKPNPTKNQTPIITGKVLPKLADITKVELSFDKGKSWQIAKQLGNTFSITLNKLEDGNYPLSARAFDAAANIGTSDIQILIIDTIPPIIGGGMQTFGPQILIPDINGRIKIVAGANTTLALSMKGGVTEAKVETQDLAFDLKPQTESNLWFGNLKFDTKGEKQLKITAVDGAGNKTERNLNTILVEDFGKVIDSKNQKPIEGAKVSIYFLETQGKQWVLWEGESYGQSNPQVTNKEGAYSFMVPPSRYYVQVQKPGYNSMQSEILSVSETSIINYKFPLSSKPKLIFNLPIFGEVVLAVPSFVPPQTLPRDSLTQTSSKNILPKLTFIPGTPAPNLQLPNLSNSKVKLSDFKNSKVLLSFISPWSAQSLEQAAILSKASLKSLSDEKIAVLLLQESLALAETFMKRGNYKFQVLVDSDGQTAANYKIALLPQNFLIDKSGKIQEVYVGVLSEKQLVEKFKKLK